MKQDMDAASLDEIFESFSLESPSPRNVDDGTALTIWIPREYKLKFDMCQARSQKKFGKLLKKLVMTTIDRFPSEEKAG
jgi:hypothetical protein